MVFDDAFAALIGNEGGYVNDPAAREKCIVVAIRAAIFAEQQRAVGLPGLRTLSRETRAYKCSHPGCGRGGYSRGFCNLHYTRARRGADMDAIPTARKRSDRCAECDAETGAKGGWGLCQRHYRARRYRAIKDAVVAAMGGTCERCRGSFDRRVFDFHHRGEKSGNPSSLLINASPEAIAAELSQCALLCANCHRLEHVDDL